MTFFAKMTDSFPFVTTFFGTCYIVFGLADCELYFTYLTVPYLFSGAIPPRRVVAFHRTMNQMMQRYWCIKVISTLGAYFVGTVFGTTGRNPEQSFIPCRVRTLQRTGTRTIFAFLTPI